MVGATHQKLSPTPAAAQCECKHLSQLLLVYIFSNNPIHCFACKNEVSPEQLGLSSKQTDHIAQWHRTHPALNLLWLDSQAYEKWALLN